MSSKTQILLATFRTQSQPEGILCIFEVARLFQIVGCVRNKRQYPTVPQNRKSFRWMLVGLRMDGLPALGFMGCGDRSVNRTVPKHQSTQQQETVRGITISNPNTRETEVLTNCRMWTHVTTNSNSSQGESQLYIFEDIEAVIIDDHQWQKSNNETRVKNSQSCAGLVV